MKKSILFLAGAALLFAGCAKVEDEAPIPENGKRVVTLKATIDEADTRVSVETDGTYHWQAGDEIGVWVVDSDGGAPYKYTTEDSGTTANFAVTLDAGEAIGEYAFYPFSEDSFVGGEGPRVALDANLDYVEGTTYMPMLGTISSDGTISFKSVGGVIKLTVNNIPSNAARLLFSAKDTNNENLVISGVFPVSGDQITSGGIMGLNSVNIDFTDKWKSSMEFYVPLPTGTYGGFELEFVNANSSETLVSKKVNFGSTGLTISRNQIIVAPALDATPPVVEKYYTKVNSNADLVSGQYLIVYEEGSVAFNGALGTLDAVNNGISVVMNNGKILSTPETDAASFTINIGSTNSTIKSASGYYIGQTSDANGLKSSTTEAYTNTITYDSDGNAVNISSGGAYFRYNKNSDQKRFRFFKSSTYTSQQAIALYVLETTSRTPAELAFSSSTAEAIVGQTGFTGPQLTKNPADISVTWSSSQPSVAYIDQTSGEIHINNAGTAIITASFAGDSDYAPATAFYTLTVKPAYTITLQNVTDGKVFVGAASSSSVKFMVTSSYDWTSSVSFDSDFNSSFTVSPTLGEAGEVEVTVTSSIANATDAARKLGSVVISNQGATQTVEVWQKAVGTDYEQENSSNVDLVNYGTPANATKAKVVIGTTEFPALKAGTGGDAGVAKVKIPAGTKSLHIHIAGWNNENVTVSVTGAPCTPNSFSITSDAGIKGNSPFSLSGETQTFYKEISLQNITDETFITFTATEGNRFVLWGVNAEQ